MTEARKTLGRLGAKTPLFVGFATITLLALGFGGWAAKAQIAGAVVSSGQVVVERNRQVVQHPDGGVVKAVLVSEGDTVQQGDLLVSLNAERALSEYKIVSGEYFELMARRGRLEAERDETPEVTFDPILLEHAEDNPEIRSVYEGQVRLFTARAETVEKELTQLANQRFQLNDQIEGIDAQIKALGRQAELIGREIVTQETLLSQGLAQASRLLNLQREEARLEGQMGDLTSRRAEALQEITELEIQGLQLHSRRREEAITRLRDLQFREMEMAERRRGLEAQLREMEIRAPISGVIYNLQVFGPGSVIRVAEPVLYLVPQDRPLLIEAKVEPNDIEIIYPGQEVVVRIAAFDMRDTPTLYGSVIQISPDSFVDEQSGASFYRVEVVLPEEEIDKLPEGQHLIPGMSVDTFIQTNTRTPISYLTGPIVHYFDKAFRDG